MHGRAPYKHVLTHGWTLDEHGRPMSKSLGNVVLPTEICEKWGADLLRLWVASQDYTADVRMSDNVMTQLSEAYRKIRNTFRFAAGNLADFDPQRDALRDADLWEIDRWMLTRTADLVRQCRQRYDAFEFHRVFHALHDFCVVDLSAFYFDVLKDRLYTFAPANPGRRSAQTAVYRIASALIRLLAPIMVFTAEEIWKHLPRAAGHAESIHLALLPQAEEMGAPVDAGVSDNWDKLLKLRRAVLVHLETARNQQDHRRFARSQGPSQRRASRSRPLAQVRRFAPGAVHRLAGRDRHSRRYIQERRTMSLGIARRRRRQVRALLELLHPRRRERRLPHRLRALRRGAGRNRASGAGRRRILMGTAPSARWLWLAARDPSGRPRHQVRRRIPHR